MAALSYELGRLAGRRPWAAVAVLGACAVALYAAFTLFGSTKDAGQNAAASAGAQRMAELRAQCASSRPRLVVEYQAVLPSDAASAAAVVQSCAAILNDAELIAMAREAGVLAYSKTAFDASALPAARLDALQRLQDLAGASPRIDSERAKIKAAQEREQKKQAAALAEKKRREGVAIGMSPQDVLASSWGKPEKINVTVTERGQREQWVYPGFQYLYFTDGVLDAIQTKR